MPIEQLNLSVSKQPSEMGVHEVITQYAEVLGQAIDVPESMTEKQIFSQINALRRDGEFATMEELLAYHKLVNRMASNQLQGSLEDASRPKIDTAELTMKKEGEAYFSYMRLMLRHVEDTMQRAEAIAASLPASSPELDTLQNESKLYVQTLSSVMHKRLAFSNVLLALDMQKNAANKLLPPTSISPDAIQKNIAKYMAVLKEVDTAGLLALQMKDTEAIQLHAHALDQEFVKILATSGHLPARWLLALQAAKYQGLLDDEVQHVRSTFSYEHAERWKELSARNESAARNEGSPLTEEEKEEYRALLSEQRMATLDVKKLRMQREESVDELLQSVGDLSDYQERAFVLTRIQEQFRSLDQPMDASLPSNNRTPEEIEQSMLETMDARSRFHRERMQLFVSRFDEEVLHIGTAEYVEDLSMNARDPVRRVVTALSGIMTLPLPDSMGIRSFARDQLDGPINDALGWPEEKRDLSFDELTPEEQKVVEDRCKSVLDAIQSFDRTTIEEVYETMEVLEMLPPARTAVGQSAPDPENLPDERLTKENVQAMLQKYNVPTVYMMAVRQLDQDMGSPDSGGFLGEVAQFTKEVNGIVGIHLEVADAMYEAADAWKNMAYALLAAAGLALAIGVASGLAARPLMRMSGRAAGRLASAGRDTILRSRPMWKRIPRAGLTVAVVGYAGIKLLRNYTRDKRLETLGRADGVQAAMELMKVLQEKAKGGIPLFMESMEYLHMQHECILMEDAVRQQLEVWEQKVDSDQAEKQQDQIATLEQFLSDVRAVADEAQKNFPLTDYLRTDPAGEPGNVGFSIRGLDRVLQDGIDYRRGANKDLNLSSLPDSSVDKRPDLSSDSTKGPSSEMLRILKSPQIPSTAKTLHERFDELILSYLKLGIREK